MATVKLRVSLSGSLGNAARCIETMAKELKARCTPEEYDDLDEQLQTEYHAFCLREIAEHASGTRKGVRSLEEFADHYCLAEPKDD